MIGSGGHLTIWDIILFGIAYNVCFPRKLGRLLICKLELPIPYPLITIRTAVVIIYVTIALSFVQLDHVDGHFLAFMPLGYMTILAVLYAGALSVAGYGADDDPWS